MNTNRNPVTNENPREKVRGTKRDAILNAALDLVVEGGFHATPMSAIGRRANASAGVIYHHFASKEEIFQEIYERTRHLKRASLLDGYSSSMDAKEGFIRVAINAYAFYRRHQNELRFVHLYEDAGFPVPESALKSSPEVIAFQQHFGSRSGGGVLADLPPHVIHEMSLGLLARLARDPKRLSSGTLQQIAERVWESLKA